MNEWLYLSTIRSPEKLPSVDNNGRARYVRILSALDIKVNLGELKFIYIFRGLLLLFFLTHVRARVHFC